eukprot:scaffold935_cov248-Pinguiococcus_pyrenoidosus.AAC.20
MRCICNLESYSCTPGNKAQGALLRPEWKLRGETGWRKLPATCPLNFCYRHVERAAGQRYISFDWLGGTGASPYFGGIQYLLTSNSLHPPQSNSRLRGRSWHPMPGAPALGRLP